MVLYLVLQHRTVQCRIGKQIESALLKLLHFFQEVTLPFNQEILLPDDREEIGDCLLLLAFS